MSDKPEDAGETYRKLVDQIYAGALDPAGYVEMVRAWDAHYQAQSEGQGGPTSTPEDFDWTKEFIDHFDRAGEIFERLSSDGKVSLEARAEATPGAALVASTTGRVTFANGIALQTLGAVQGRALHELAVDQQAKAALGSLLRAAKDEDGSERMVLRLAPDGPGDAAIFVADVFRDATYGGQAIFLRSAHNHWHDDALETLRTSFALTQAEADLVKRLQLGAGISDIAAQTGRSQATLRTQLSAAMGKMGVKNQAALARAVSGLITVLSRDDLAALALDRQPPAAQTKRQRLSTLTLAQGQTVQIAESGDLSGTPFYFIQTTTWPTLTPPIVEALADQGIRLISPFRSGLGETSGLPPAMKLPEIAAYHADIIDQLGLQSVLIGGHCSGGVYALALARLLKPRCRGVVLVDTGAPLETVGMINAMPLAPRRLYLAARLFPLALRTPYKLVRSDFFSGPEGEARGVQYFVEGAPHDTQSVSDPALWAVVRDNFGYVMTNLEQAIKDMSLWASEKGALAAEAMPHAPLTYLQGRENLVHAAAHLERFAQKHAPVTAHIIEDEGQLLIYRRPDIFARVIAEAAER